jgi:carbon-monoxide dehydrogenase small subunit
MHGNPGARTRAGQTLTMQRTISIELNGRGVTHSVEPRTSLADLVRGACNLPGTHLGCEHGVCGACTVVVDDVPMRSCILYAVQADGSAVRTIEGFDQDPVMEELRQAFTRHHALQCGFCTPGMLITSRDIVLRFKDPDEARIREELGGNLCRCTGYVGIVAAIREVASHGHAAVRREAPAPAVPPPPIPTHAETAPVAPPLPSPSAARNMVSIRENVRFAHSPQRVWEILSSPERVAGCLPGAELESFEGAVLKGKLKIRLGPITSAFVIEGVQARDDANLRGHVEGHGRDSMTGSRARGRIDFGVSGSDSDGESRMDIEISFSIQGMLAQFSRAAVVQELARQLIDQFAANVSTVLEGGAVPQGGPAAQQINAASMLFAALRRVVQRLFRRDS